MGFRMARNYRNRKVLEILFCHDGEKCLVGDSEMRQEVHLGAPVFRLR